MRTSTYWTIKEFSAVVGVSESLMRRAICESDRAKPIWIGGTQVIRKNKFFDWYENGGRMLICDQFPKSTIMHENIEREMNEYHAYLRR